MKISILAPLSGQVLQIHQIYSPVQTLNFQVEFPILHGIGISLLTKNLYIYGSNIFQFVSAKASIVGSNVVHHLFQCLDTHRQDVSLGYQSSQGVSVLNYLNVGDVDAINQVFQLDECFIQFLVQFLHVIAGFIALLYLGAFLDTFFQLATFFCNSALMLNASANFIIFYFLYMTF